MFFVADSPVVLSMPDEPALVEPLERWTDAPHGYVRLFEEFALTERLVGICYKNDISSWAFVPAASVMLSSPSWSNWSTLIGMYTSLYWIVLKIVTEE